MQTTAVARRRVVRSDSRSAFTLVELLVVIGIIALLIGILLPTLGKARQQAQRAKCLSQIRSILQAAEVHQATHRGYYPLCGWVPGASPEELGDRDRIKYDYGDPSSDVYVTLKDGTKAYPSLADIVVALGMIMNKDKRLQGLATTDLVNDPTGVARYFLCPSHTSEPSQVMTVGGTAYNYNGAPNLQDQWACMYCTDPDSTTSGDLIVSQEPCSYVFNAYVLGFDTGFEGGSKPVTGRLRGKASKVRSPAQTVFCSDGYGTNQYFLTGLSYYPDIGFPIGFWHNTGYTPTGKGLTGVSLLNAYSIDGRAGARAMFDKTRHQMNIDIGFCDGHAETRRITNRGNDLGTAFIVGP